jgi:2-oxoglutarate dehydrogenase E2 component (dihydrolipoamide succinyltransferase)
MATEVLIPEGGESITQMVLLKWHKADGDSVVADEPLAEMETDKANLDLKSPASGVLKRLRKEGETVAVGESIGRIEAGNGAALQSADPTIKPAAKAPAATAPAPAVDPAAPPATVVKAEDLSPAVRTMVMENNLDTKQITATGPGGKLTKQDVQTYMTARSAAPKTPTAAPIVTAKPPAPPVAAPVPPPAAPKPPVVVLPAPSTADGIRREPMSKIRKRIAETLVNAQKTAAILTTFNEIDMSAISDLRAKYKERFQEVHGIGLGFMSFFARATAQALREFPRVNGSIDGDDTVYHDYLHLGVAVSTERGLAVPVLRNVHLMSFARIESEIKRLATATRDGKLQMEELSGATFTITNGGVFGSLLSTPILLPPQSGILGMHAIQKRPVVVNDAIVIRPMMYVALSYDHRLVDGRESVSFLVRLKQLIEDPARLMLEI